MRLDDIPWQRLAGQPREEDKYLDGHIYAFAIDVDIKKGRDLHNFRTRLWKAARLEQKAIRTRVVGDILYIQALGPWSEDLQGENTQIVPTQAAAELLGPPQPSEPAPGPQDQPQGPDPA